MRWCRHGDDLSNCLSWMCGFVLPAAWAVRRGVADHLVMVDVVVGVIGLITIVCLLATVIRPEVRSASPLDYRIQHPGSHFNDFGIRVVGSVSDSHGYHILRDVPR
jgi:hypothetical protein